MSRRLESVKSGFRSPLGDTCTGESGALFDMQVDTCFRSDLCTEKLAADKTDGALRIICESWPANPELNEAPVLSHESKEQWRHALCLEKKQTDADASDDKFEVKPVEDEPSSLSHGKEVKLVRSNSESLSFSQANVGASEITASLFDPTASGTRTAAWRKRGLRSSFGRKASSPQLVVGNIQLGVSPAVTKAQQVIDVKGLRQMIIASPVQFSRHPMQSRSNVGLRAPPSLGL